MDVPVSGYEGIERRRCVGVELEEIPLCGDCYVETSGEAEDRVLERGLETVSRFDGGLSRDRLDMLSGVQDEGGGALRLAPKILTKNTSRMRRTVSAEGGLMRSSNECNVSDMSISISPHFYGMSY